MATRLKGYLLAALLCVSVQHAYANGPAQVARADFSLWPLPIASSRDFDTASRAELIVSALELDSYAGVSIAPADLGIRKLHADSLASWQQSARQEWLEQFRAASADCQPGELACGFSGDSWESLITFAHQVEQQELAAEPFQRWLANTRPFYATYLKEQLRLAALFPAPTSEILKLAPSELQGHELAERQFLLSFDDGPTAAGGHTERYVALLQQHRVSAFFFVLGDALARRLQSTPPEAMNRLYAGQCLASHGYEHQPHPRLPHWQQSLDRTRELIRQIDPDLPAVMFRPPYGQRQEQLVQYLGQEGARVILWNIDSQDWNRRISADEISDRIRKLMLLKRRGIILLHDVQPKGLVALPEIFEFARQSGLQWLDCHSVGPVPGALTGTQRQPEAEAMQPGTPAH